MNKKSGQSLIELLVAMAILVIVMAASFQLFFGGQRLLSDTVNSNLAYDYAQEGIDALRSIRDRDWFELDNGTYGLEFHKQSLEWVFASSAEDTKDLFTRSVEIAALNDNLKIATTTIEWEVELGRVQTIVIVEQLARWENLTETSCKPGPLTGNWTLPQTIGTGDLGPGNEGTDIVVKFPYVYMSGVASAASKPDIFVYDISAPSSPTLAGSLDIGANGTNALFVSGSYLYAASGNNSKELVVFNISDPLNISEAASLNLSGATDALTVTVFANTAAIGRASGADAEIAFIDVSNPGNPSLISEFQIGGKVTDFTYMNNRLYAATNEMGKEVYIFDITNPAAPSQLTTYDIPGTDEAVSAFMHLKSGQINLLIGNSTTDELIILGATSTNLYVRDRLSLGGDVNDITCVEGNLVYVATTNSTEEFVIVDSTSPDDIFKAAFLNYPQLGTGIDFTDNYVYMSVRSNDALRNITSSP